MRKVVIYMVMSLDGFVCGEHDELDWEKQDEAVSRYLIPKLLERTDTMLLGRILFKGFEQAWPPMVEDKNLPQDLRDFARWIEDTPKIVFSRTLKDADWKNSRLVRFDSDKDIVQEISKLKTLEGKDMVVFGGTRFAQTLARLNLVDEFIFKVQPIALGKGKSLFGNITDRQNLQLIDSKAFDNGVVALTYKPENS
jgi:dihydrofolate reductase